MAGINKMLWNAQGAVMLTSDYRTDHTMGSEGAGGRGPARPPPPSRQMAVTHPNSAMRWARTSSPAPMLWLF